MRLILEPANVRFVAERATDEEIREIIKYEREAAALILSGHPYTQADQKFHSAIAKATHNNVIGLMMPAIEDSVREALKTAMYLGTDKRSAENALQNHKKSQISLKKEMRTELHLQCTFILKEELQICKLNVYK